MDETEDPDRISDLPPFIIHHIMSFLSAKDVCSSWCAVYKLEEVSDFIPPLGF